jgi:hypothetical protein
LFSFMNLKFATREQLQHIHHLGSDRNALKVLGQIKDYLHIQTHKGRNVYYLNKEGRELVGEETDLKWNTRVDHHLMRNDLYIYYGLPKSWKVEQKLTFKPQLSNKEYTLVPDANFQKGHYHFIEVDRMQSMNENKKKIELYQQLSPLIHEQFQHTPTIVFYTLTAIRKEKLTALCQKAQLQNCIYTKEDLF